MQRSFNLFFSSFQLYLNILIKRHMCSKLKEIICDSWELHRYKIWSLWSPAQCDCQTVYKLSKFLLNLWLLTSLTPLETVSPWSLFSLWLLSSALALAISSHHQCTTDTLKAHSFLHRGLCLKSHFKRAFLHNCL